MPTAAGVWESHRGRFLARCGECCVCQDMPEEPCLTAPGRSRLVNMRTWWARAWGSAVTDLPTSGLLPAEPDLLPPALAGREPRAGLLAPLRTMRGDMGGLALCEAQRGSGAVRVPLEDSASGLVAFGWTGMAARMDTVILAEGPWDAWAAELLCDRLPVVVLGALRRADLLPIARELAGRRHGRVVVVPRLDAAGQRLAAAAVAELYTAGATARLFPTGAWLRAVVVPRISGADAARASLSSAWTLWPMLDLGTARQAFVDALAGRLDQRGVRHAA